MVCSPVPSGRPHATAIAVAVRLIIHSLASITYTRANATIIIESRPLPRYRISLVIPGRKSGLFPSPQVVIRK